MAQLAPLFPLCKQTQTCWPGGNFVTVVLGRCYLSRATMHGECIILNCWFLITEAWRRTFRSAWMTNIWQGYENTPRSTAHPKEDTGYGNVAEPPLSQPCSTPALRMLEGHREVEALCEGQLSETVAKTVGYIKRGGVNKAGVWAGLSCISIFITPWLFPEQGGSSQYAYRHQLNTNPPILYYTVAS